MSVSRADVERVIQLVNSGDVEALKSQEFEQFQYQGFDPYKIVEALLGVKLARNETNDNFKRDIFTIVAVGLIKGSVNEHNIHKMSDSGKQELREMISKYGIKMGGGQGLASNIITFPRVMATFPDIAVRMVSVVGPKTFTGGPMGSSRLPDYMQVQVFPSVIPRDCDADVKRMLLTASLCYSIDQTIQISRLQGPDLKALSATQSNFTNISHRSPVPSEDVRKELFSKLTIAKDYAKIQLVLQSYVANIDSGFEIMTEKQFKQML